MADSAESNELNQDIIADDGTSAPTFEFEASDDNVWEYYISLFDDVPIQEFGNESFFYDGYDSTLGEYRKIPVFVANFNNFLECDLPDELSLDDEWALFSDIMDKKTAEWADGAIWVDDEDYLICNSCGSAIQWSFLTGRPRNDPYWQDDECNIICAHCVRQNPAEYLAWLSKDPLSRSNDILDEDDLEELGYTRYSRTYNTRMTNSEKSRMLADARETYPGHDCIFDISDSDCLALWVRTEG